MARKGTLSRHARAACVLNEMSLICGTTIDLCTTHAALACQDIFIMIIETQAAPSEIAESRSLRKNMFFFLDKITFVKQLLF